MRKLLYIDDSAADRLLASLALAGYADVTCAAGAGEGLALLSGGGFDLVVTDMMMPERDGLDVARAVAHTGTPLILASSCRALTSFEDYTGLGNYLGFILKPIDAEKVRMLAEGRRAALA